MMTCYFTIFKVCKIMFQMNRVAFTFFYQLVFIDHRFDQMIPMNVNKVLHFGDMYKVLELTWQWIFITLFFKFRSLYFSLFPCGNLDLAFIDNLLYILNSIYFQIVELFKLFRTLCHNLIVLDVKMCFYFYEFIIA